jgi:phosphatidylcholine synthase
MKVAASLRAYATHALTAAGGVFAFLALLDAVEGRFARMFVWLVVALVIDGIDGPLARRFDVGTNAPIIDGVILDLVIDFLTYVFVPVFALHRAGLLPGRTGMVVAGLVVLASTLYFADTRMKTADGSFSGFPACWNMVALVVFASRPSSTAVMSVVLGLTLLMFLPVRFVHPVRTRRWRRMSLPVALVWTTLAGFAALNDLHMTGPARWLLLSTSGYLLLAGALQQVRGSREGALGDGTAPRIA